MTDVAAEQELYRACRIIFGSNLDVSREFLEYLQLSGVKSAFRKKAMETHPDRLAGQDQLTRNKSVRLFHSVKNAYEQLTRYVDAREKGFRFPGRHSPATHLNSVSKNNGRQSKSHQESPPSAKRSFAARQTSHQAFYGRNLYRGHIPERGLLFGQYLYYAGQISWQDLNQAILWQRTQRPRLGEIARERGWLRREDILLVLRSASRLSHVFGEQALHLGLLTRAQLQLLLFEQKRRHRRIGEFFVLHHILTRSQLLALLSRFNRHNAIHIQSRRFSAR
ncbi:MAG: J domain-containing protein [Pseudomonadota bacterium]